MQYHLLDHFSAIPLNKTVFQLFYMHSSISVASRVLGPGVHQFVHIPCLISAATVTSGLRRLYVSPRACAWDIQAKKTVVLNRNPIMMMMIPNP